MTSQRVGPRHPSVGSINSVPLCNLHETAHGNLPQKHKMVEGVKQTAFPGVSQVRRHPPAQSPQPVNLTSVRHSRRPASLHYPGREAGANVRYRRLEAPKISTGPCSNHTPAPGTAPPSQIHKPRKTIKIGRHKPMPPHMAYPATGTSLRSGPRIILPLFKNLLDRAANTHYHRFTSYELLAVSL
jgi:hypothetical protein